MFDFRSRSRAVLGGAAALCVLLVCSLAFAQGVAPPAAPDAPLVTGGEVQAVAGAVRAHAWVLLAALVVHWVLRLSADGVRPFAFSIPLAWRPIAAVALGQLAAALDMVVQGASWQVALGGLVAGLTAAALLPHPQPDVTAIAGELLTTTGDGQPQANGSGEAAPAPRAGVAAKAGSVATMALFLAGCTPGQKAIVRTAEEVLAPLACEQLANVMNAGTVVAQLCEKAADAATAELLAKVRASKLSGGACGDHQLVVDAQGKLVGWACSSLAPVAAASVGGKVVPAR